MHPYTGVCPGSSYVYVPYMHSLMFQLDVDRLVCISLGVYRDQDCDSILNVCKSVICVMDAASHRVTI